MLDLLKGKCIFTSEQIKSRMGSVCEKANGIIENIKMLQEQSSEAEAIASELMDQHQKLLPWAEMFDSASTQEKKMVASYIIKAVTLTRDYGIQVEFSISAAWRWDNQMLRDDSR